MRNVKGEISDGNKAQIRLLVGLAELFRNPYIYDVDNVEVDKKTDIIEYAPELSEGLEFYTNVNKEHYEAVYYTVSISMSTDLNAHGLLAEVRRIFGDKPILGFKLSNNRNEDFSIFQADLVPGEQPDMEYEVEEKDLVFIDLYEAPLIDPDVKPNCGYNDAKKHPIREIKKMIEE